MTEDYAGIMSC